MNMKNMKKFFTLSRRAEGFTLVELIVVIAILAILGGVAVPAYGGYVKKANMQADISLISELEQALELAYYSQDLAEGDTGLVMLQPQVEAGAPEQLDPIMEKVFGSNWKQMLQLKYDGWDAKSMMLDQGSAETVVNSTFVQEYSPNELLSQVQALTSAVKNLNISVGNQDKSVYDMYGKEDGGNVLDDLAAKYYGEDASWDTIKDETTKSNLLVLATASSFGEEGNATGASDVISEYSQYVAYAAVDPAFNTAYETFLTDISTAKDVQAVKDAYKTLEAAGGEKFKTWSNENSGNTTAFEQIMVGVNNAMKDNGDAIIAALGNEDMFTNGIGSEMFNDYLNSAYAIKNDDGMIASYLSMLKEMPGAVIVWYAVVDGKLYIDNSLPLY